MTHKLVSSLKAVATRVATLNEALLPNIQAVLDTNFGGNALSEAPTLLDVNPIPADPTAPLDIPFLCMYVQEGEFYVQKLVLRIGRDNEDKPAVWGVIDDAPIFSSTDKEEAEARLKEGK